ncbi:hypothetical protein RND81_04G029100 [Saponaria officinalis]|uniref:Uncharacterized protein n=1 Tax=Saponaria officinalis TaxID=3572 RepID=A0AAW1LIC0_SAPOF
MTVRPHYTPLFPSHHLPSPHPYPISGGHHRQIPTLAKPPLAGSPPSPPSRPSPSPSRHCPSLPVTLVAPPLDWPPLASTFILPSTPIPLTTSGPCNLHPLPPLEKTLNYKT